MADDDKTGNFSQQPLVRHLGVRQDAEVSLGSEQSPVVLHRSAQPIVIHDSLQPTVGRVQETTLSAKPPEPKPKG